MLSIRLQVFSTHARKIHYAAEIVSRFSKATSHWTGDCSFIVRITTTACRQGQQGALPSRYENTKQLHATPWRETTIRQLIVSRQEVVAVAAAVIAPDYMKRTVRESRPWGSWGPAHYRDIFAKGTCPIV